MKVMKRRFENSTAGKAIKALVKKATPERLSPQKLIERIRRAAPNVHQFETSFSMPSRLFYDPKRKELTYKNYLPPKEQTPRLAEGESQMANIWGISEDHYAASIGLKTNSPSSSSDPIAAYLGELFPNSKYKLDRSSYVQNARGYFYPHTHVFNNVTMADLRKAVDALKKK